MVTNKCRDRNSALPMRHRSMHPRAPNLFFALGKRVLNFFWILFLVWKGRTAKEVTVN